VHAVVYVVVHAVVHFCCARCCACCCAFASFEECWLVACMSTLLLVSDLSCFISFFVCALACMEPFFLDRRSPLGLPGAPVSSGSRPLPPSGVPVLGRSDLRPLRSSTTLVFDCSGARPVCVLRTHASTCIPISLCMYPCCVCELTFLCASVLSCVLPTVVDTCSTSVSS
jgi:hypothetical protein